MKTKFVVLFVSISALMIVLSACAASNLSEIAKPQELYRSPQLDFTKVEKCGVIPVNNYGTEVPEVTDLLANGLYNDLKQSQKAWEVVSAEDILRKINDLGIARGYQNYIADLNTFATAGGATPLFTSETQKFFEDLKKKMGIEALLFTSYNYNEQESFKDFLGLKIKNTARIVTVYTAIYDISSKRTWWVARISMQQDVSEPIQNLVNSITLAFSQNFGKGTLRQL